MNTAKNKILNNVHKGGWDLDLFGAEVFGTASDAPRVCMGASEGYQQTYCAGTYGTYFHNHTGGWGDFAVGLGAGAIDFANMVIAVDEAGIRVMGGPDINVSIPNATCTNDACSEGRFVGFTATAEVVTAGVADILGGAGGAGAAGEAGDGLFAPGPYAGESIPAENGSSRAFTASERAEMNRIGADTGCHRCGATDPGTKSGNFVPDHQPPNAVNPAGGAQRLYPHCIQCSRERD